MANCPAPSLTMTNSDENPFSIKPPSNARNRGDAPMAFALDPQGIEMVPPAGDFGDRRMGIRLQAAQRLLG
jgi:hypothetical protein